MDREATLVGEVMTTSTTTVSGTSVNTTQAMTYQDGRLKEVDIGGSAVEVYTYDANGNRTSASPSGNRPSTTQATPSYTTYDEQDRLVTYGSTSSNQQVFTYTKNGERLTKVAGGVTTTYTYDGFGSLMSVVPSSGTRVDYIVDGVGRRVGRKEAGTLKAEYLWDGPLRIVAELDGSGTLQRRYVYGTHANVPDFMVDNASGATPVVYRVITDQLGSVRMVVGLDGTIKEKHTYDSFGNEIASSRFVNSTWTQIPFGFAGGLYDAVTGLYRCGARDYDSAVGTWLSKDADGLAWGTNLCAYSISDPINVVDVNGRQPSRSYDSLESAGIAAALDAAAHTRADGVEYGGLIYSLGGGKYAYTDLVKGSFRKNDGWPIVNPDAAKIPVGCRADGRFHSHPKVEKGLKDDFSNDDLTNARNLNQSSFLGTAAGEVLEFRVDDTSLDEMYSYWLLAEHSVAVSPWQYQY